MTLRLVEPTIVGSQQTQKIIVGTGKKDKITGTKSGEILFGREGKDILKGRGGADGFLFQSLGGYGKNKADVIVDFTPKYDSIFIDRDFFDLGKRPSLKLSKGGRSTRKASATRSNFVYDKAKGLLYFNENAELPGWGDGGLLAMLKGAPEIAISDFTLF